MKSLKLTGTNKAKLAKALDDLASHCASAADAWPSLTSGQRSELLAHSPVLARLIAMTDFARGGDSWPR